MPLESCPGGHGASKSSWDPKNVDYSPRKQPEMPEIMSFHDAAGVMYLGSRGIEILPGPKTWTIAHEPSELPEIMSFHDAAGVVYRGSRGIEILPRHKKRGL